MAQRPTHRRGDVPIRERLLAKERWVDQRSSAGGDLSVNLVYPNHYWIAMSNLGFQAVHRSLIAQGGVRVERAFLPDNKDQRSGGGKLSPPVKTFEASRPLADCDLLAFSLSFETDYPNLISLLNSAGLLFDSHQARLKHAESSRFGAPLIIVGGTAATLNPEPIADFVDIIFLGEAEEFIPELVEGIRQARASELSRTDLLRRLSHIEGVYVPSFVQPEFNSDNTVRQYLYSPGVGRPQRRFVKDLSAYPAYSSVLTTETEFRDMFLVETGRGCEMGCRFCVAGYAYRPVRKRSESSLRESVQNGLKHARSIGFVGAAVSSHRAIGKLAEEVAAAGARASLSSLMSQKVSNQLAGSLSESEYKTVALAPEAGNERLRRAAGKRVTDGQIVDAAIRLVESGIRGFKLYFIVGLPTELETDVDDIARLAIRIRNEVVDRSKDTGKVGWVSLSVNPFIPKAVTPFQWEPMLRRDDLEIKIARIKELIKGVPNLELRYESPKESYFQALLSRGDRRVGKLLLLLEEQGRDWKYLVTNGSLQLLPEVPPPDFYIHRRFSFDELLPWESVNARVDKRLLMREALRAVHGEEFVLDGVQESAAEEQELAQRRATSELVETALFG